MTSGAELLLRDPLLAQCSRTSLTRLLPHLEQRRFAAGDVLYRAGEPAAGLYLLADGTVQLKTAAGELHATTDARCGEECLTDADRHLADAVATSDVTAWFVPRDSLLPLLAERPAMRSGFMQALLASFVGHPPESPGGAERAARREQPSTPRLLGWLAAILLPLVVLRLTNDAGMERNTAMFLTIFAATVVMWSWSLVDDYLPGLFAVMAILIAGLVPAPVILSGFASDGFMMAMSILGLGAVLVSSGLSYRTLLLMLHRLPESRFWQNLGLTSIGVFLTPLLPTINGRVALIAPFYIDMTRSLRLSAQGAAATQLAVSAFAGVSLFSAVFLSSKSVNFAVFSLLPAQTQDHFQGFKWLIAAGVVAAVLLGCHALLASLMFRGREPLRLSREAVAAQLEMLGRPTRREWAAVIGIAVFIGGMLTTGLHQIQAPWMGLAIFYALLLFGSLSRKELKEKIDWPFLLYLSGLTGMVNAFNFLGIDRQLAAQLPALGATMREDFGLFVLLLFAAICVIRLAVPISAAIVILASLLMPVAEISGVNPWVVGFCILLLGEIWFLPYQCSYYLQFQAINRRDPLYRENGFLLYNGAMNFARLAAVYVSIPFWKAFGLL